MNFFRHRRSQWWLPVMALLALLFSLLLLWLVRGQPPSSANFAPSRSSAAMVAHLAPPLPVLTLSTPQQKRYRIDPAQSAATYQVQEVLLGTIEGRLVSAVSREMSGELLVDLANPPASQVGAIVINVEALTSDSRLRDSRIRAAYLESSRYPTVTFVPTQLHAFPVAPQMNEAFTFTLDGSLTVKAMTIATTWAVTTTLTADRLVGRATTTVSMSNVGVGPIQIAGLLETEDELQLQLDFVALPVTEELPTAVAQPALTRTEILTPPQRIAGAPEFFADVEPILARRCTGCHLPGQIGHGVYPMETARDVVAYADDLALVVEHGYMPPWPPGPLTPPLQQARILVADELATLMAWVAAGAPVDGPLDAPLQAATDPDNAGVRPDLTLQMAEPYLPTGATNDDYRCFLIDPALTADRYFTGYEFAPGNVGIVHHIILFVVDEASRVEADARAYSDGRPGWQCFGDTGLPDTTTTVAISWTPGEGAVHFPAGTGVPLDQDSLFVLQVHYNLASGVAADQSGAVLQLSAAGEKLQALHAIDLVAPVEIPCPAGDTSHHCQRSQAIANVQAYDPNADIFADSLLFICDRTLADYRNQPHDHLITTCNQEVTLAGDAVSVYAHMHQLGKAFRIELNPDTPAAQVLLDIPHWDFDWQSTYTYETPVSVKPGDNLRITCTYANAPMTGDASATQAPAQWQTGWQEWWAKTAHAHSDPTSGDYRYIIWGEGTRDEMCLGSLVVRPADGVAQVIRSSYDLTDWQILVGVWWLRLQRQWVAVAAAVAVVGLGFLGIRYWQRRGQRALP